MNDDSINHYSLGIPNIHQLQYFINFFVYHIILQSISIDTVENTVDNLHNSTCNISYPSIAGEDETALLEISSNDDVNDTPKNEE